jgi:hypothetical protein
VTIPEPVESILDEKSNDFVTFRAVEVYALSPRGSVVIREIGSKLAEVVTFRTQVVIDYIEHHRQFKLMAGLDQPTQALGATISILYGKRISPVVTPIAIAWELGYRHQLKRRHSQLFYFTQIRDDRIEGSLAAVSPDMDFINDVVVKCEPQPAYILPLIFSWINDLGSSVNAFGLKPRGRVGPPLLAIEAINVPRPWPNPRGDPYVITSVRSLQPN